MAFELWDTDSRNIVEAFEYEADALLAARELIALNSTVYPCALALVFEDDEGETTLLARGPELVALVHGMG